MQNKLNMVQKNKLGYIYTIDGQVVVNPKKMPDVNYYNYRDRFDDDYAKWEANCIPVVNAQIYGQEDGRYFFRFELEEMKLTKGYFDGQKVFHINGEVTKIE